MSAEPDVTVQGDAYRIVPGATYAVEVDRPVSQEVLARAREDWERITGARVVFLGPGVRLVPADPHAT